MAVVYAPPAGGTGPYGFTGGTGTGPGVAGVPWPQGPNSPDFSLLVGITQEYSHAQPSAQTLAGLASAVQAATRGRWSCCARSLDVGNFGRKRVLFYGPVYPRAGGPAAPGSVQVSWADIGTTRFMHLKVIAGL